MAKRGRFLIINPNYLRGKMKEILQPLKEYEGYRRQFDDEVDSVFERLKKQSNVDEAKNRETVEKYNHIDAEYKKTKSKLATQRIWKSLLIVACVAGGIAVIIGALMLYGAVSTGESVLSGVLTVVIGALVFIGALLIIKLALDKKIKELKKLAKELKQNSDSILNEAWAQMAPLNRLFSDKLTNEMVNSLDTVIKLNDYYSVLHEVYLNRYFKLPYYSADDNSTTNLVVGTLAGNPFFASRELSKEMGSKVYEGTLLVTWTETRRDSDGKMHTVTRSQTLVATVSKPCPYYDNDTFLVYCNESAPDLNFSRKPQANGKDDKQIERMVKRGEKTLAKIADDDLKNGDGSFIAMSDTEFDVLFGAFDRDNENQFRLLFTPLAQRNVVDFVKDSPYGDDFYFVKRGKINTLYAHHADSWEMSQNGKIASYSIDIAEQRFKYYNGEFFQNLYFLLAPLLNIPIYQQHKPNDMDIDLSSETNIAARQAELMCNLLPSVYLSEIGTVTRTIYKVKFKPSIGLVDNVVIYGHSYKTILRTDFVPRLAGNGKMYSVPVAWDEYVPLTKLTDALTFDINGLEEQKRNELIELLLKNDISCEYRGGERAFVENCGVVMIIPRSGDVTALAKSIDRILRTKQKNTTVNTTEKFFEAVEKILNAQKAN